MSSYNYKKQSGGDTMIKITGADIKEARKRVGLTQENLAEETDFSLRQISRFERNENLCKLNKYFRLFQMLDIKNKGDSKDE